jgi:ribose transport system ATP-binding protein
MNTAQGMEPNAPVLEMVEVQKSFPNGTLALRGVNLRVSEGSVHGIIGANGAGKSTLIKIISGAHPASTGILRWLGVQQHWRDPGDARAAGVATNYQHVPLVPTLTVLENVFLGRGGFTRRPVAMRREFGVLLDRVGYQIDPDELVGDLPIGARQMVAILQAVALGARLVILDEPTASLAEHERAVVFDVVRRLSGQGTSFLYVSHFLDEILELTDQVTVLRDGRVVLDQATGELDESTLVQAIVGRDLMAIEGRSTPEPDPDAPAVLQVVGLSSPLGIRAVSFTVRAGEIVGLAGLLGSGRSEILHAIFGADSRAHGDVQIDGKSLRRNPRAAVAAGVAYVPEDRASQGLFSGLPLWQNESIPDLKRLSRGGLIPRKKAERARAADAVRELGIKTRSIDTRPSELSGGNAQKVVFGKWLYGDARVWLLDEPTAGIDVGAKADILVLARRFAQEGKAVVVVCSEFEELLAICSRVLVVRGGRIVAERAAARTTEPELLMLANGLGDPRREEYLDHVNS